MTIPKGGLITVGLLGVAFAISRCETVPLTAPAGSTIFLQANPPSVPANGGKALVTALVVGPAGTLVPDATEVLFITNLGRIDETAKTVDGIARVYFVSDARSGTATITAMSGGPAIAPTTSPTVSPSPSSSPTPGGSAASSGTGQAQITIAVGVVTPKHVAVGANPQRIVTPRYATIVANVTDDNGNPVQNVPVIFKIDSVTPTTALFEERLESGGSPRFTDSSGQAFDTLTTTAATSGTQKVVVVSATTSNGVTGTVTVAID
jgi:hypothetical protein